MYGNLLQDFLKREGVQDIFVLSNHVDLKRYIRVRFASSRVLNDYTCMTMTCIINILDNVCTCNATIVLVLG